MANENKEVIVSEQKQMVNEFLEEVNKKLPFWLRSQPENVTDITDELENHIWDKAYELSGSDDPSPEFVRKAINAMGSPSEIASEYNRRGKPKLFITEELFPMYLKILVIIGAVIAAFNVISMLVSISRVVSGLITVGQLFSGFFSGLVISLSIALILITIQFIYLSKEGYLPEDLSKMTHGKLTVDHLTILSTKPREKEVRPTAQKTDYITTATPAQKAITEEEKSVKILRETPAPDYATVPRTERHYMKEKVIIEKPIIIKERIKEPKAKRHFLGKNYLSEGISGIVFGVVIVVLVFMPFLDFLPYTLRIWIVIFGVIAFALGIVRFIQALVGRIPSLQIMLLVVGIIPHALEIPLWHALLDRRDILYDWLNATLHNYIAFSDNTYFIIFSVVVWFSIVVISLTILGDLIRIIKVAVEGFPEN